MLTEQLVPLRFVSQAVRFPMTMRSDCSPSGTPGPPWSERELLHKLRRAHRHGRQPLGRLQEARRG